VDLIHSKTYTIPPNILFAKQKQPRENSSMAAYAQPSFE